MKSYKKMGSNQQKPALEQVPETFGLLDGSGSGSV